MSTAPDIDTPERYTPLPNGVACDVCGKPAWKTLGSQRYCPTDFQEITAKLSPPVDPDATDDTVDGLRYTDAGNARRLVALHGDELRYVPKWRSWYVWDGRRWREDHDDAGATERAKGVARYLFQQAIDAPRKDRDAAHRWANRSEMAAGLTAMIRVARSSPDVLVDHHALDAMPYAFNLKNGTYDLAADRLYPHRPTDLLTKISDIPYDKNATCPRWHAFLEQVLPDPEVRDYVQRLFGYSITGDVGEQIIVMLIGAGANGKSVLLNLLRRLGGDYAVVAPRDLLIAQRHEPHPTSTAVLRGARIATAVETEAGARLAESKVKELTGGDQLTARRMHEDFWTFTPTHKLWLAANHRPVIRGADEGIWRRVRVVPFEYVIPPDERDRSLLAKLERELPGILRWAIDGYRKWRDEGLGLPVAVDLATAEYRAEQDIVGLFLDAAGYVMRPHSSTPAGDLRRAYEAWCTANGTDALAPTAFADALRSRGLKDARKHSGRVWQGLHLEGSELLDHAR